MGRYVTGRRSRYRSLSSLIIGLLAVAGLLVLGRAGYALFLGGTTTQVANSPVNLEKGLTGWWKLDGNAKDSTPYADNGTVTGATATTDRKGAGNAALSFSGSTQYVDSFANSISPVGSRTTCAWFKTGSTSRQGIVSTRPNGPSTGFYLAIDRTTAGNLTYAHVGGSTLEVAAGITTGVWYQACATLDASTSTAKLYLNGASVGSQGSFSAESASSYSGIIGNDQQVGGGDYFNGSLDDVRVYNRALSAAEVTALYKQYNPSLNLGQGENGLVGWWKLDGNAKDSSPYGDNGTVTGATLTTDRKGAANSAYSFPGTTNFISVPGITPPTSRFTYSAWVKPTATNFNGGIIGPHSSTSGAYMRMASSGGFQLFNEAGGTACGTGSGTAVANVWQLVTFSFDSSGNCVPYLNGVAKSPTSASAMTAFVADPIVIGQFRTAQEPFNGSIDDVRIYNRVLGAAEITNLYNSYNAGLNVGAYGQNINLSQGLVGYWPYNGNAKDETPYGNNGTVNGAVLTADRNSRANSAYSLNGTSNNIAYASNKLPSTAITVSAWVDDARNGTSYTNFINNSWTLGGGWLLYGDVNGKPLFGVIGTAPTQYNASCLTGTLVANSWHLMTGTYDGSTVKLYVDGSVCSGTASLSGQTLKTTNYTVSSGTNASTYYIDDLRIYNRALSAAEAMALYSEYN